ncbi:MAG: glycosyltransferase [Chitinispirillaceae bacterium]|nr:glycosyltransferase [Chitinispirillaceae bacterium]
MPRVSVILPTCNRCAVLRRAVQSVLDQTFTDYELIVVNDGSGDETASYLSAIASEKIRVVQRECTGGGSAARNEGIMLAAGDYCAFIDDDDAWEPKKLEEQMSVIAPHDPDLCHTGINVYSAHGRLLTYVFKKARYDNSVRSIMYDNYIGTTSSVMVRTALVREIGGFDPALPALQDWDFYLRLCRKGCLIKGIDKPLVRYYFMDRTGNVSFNYANHARAVRYLGRKYRHEEYDGIFRRALWLTTVKKGLKSGHFLRSALREMLGL